MCRKSIPRFLLFFFTGAWQWYFRLLDASQQTGRRNIFLRHFPSVFLFRDTREDSTFSCAPIRRNYRVGKYTLFFKEISRGLSNINGVEEHEDKSKWERNINDTVNMKISGRVSPATKIRETTPSLLSELKSPSFGAWETIQSWKTSPRITTTIAF